MDKQKKDIKARLLATFRLEAEEHLHTLNANLLALDQALPSGETADLIESTFRVVHTLKGAARSVSLQDVETVCQACESLMSRVKRGDLRLTRLTLTRLQEAIDWVGSHLDGGESRAEAKRVVQRIEQAAAEPVEEETALLEKPEPPPSADGPSFSSRAPATGAALQPADHLRIATPKLDTLLRRTEDFLPLKLVAEERVRQARAMVESVTKLRVAFGRGWAQKGRSGGNGHVAGHVHDLDETMRELEAQARRVFTDLFGDHRALATAVQGLQDDMAEIRMLQASSALDIFPRMVRDLAREQGKDVRWAVEGADLQIDRRVLEAMKGPLIHLVRNAVDHGIEPPGERAKAGKPLPAKIAVTVASLVGGEIEMRVEDDGRGIDLARVRNAAVRARLLTGEAVQLLSDDQVRDLIFRSGLSTSTITTVISGNGLGMAIVKEEVERLEGHVHVESRPGAGTVVRMVVPSTIATFHGLMVRAGSLPFMIPIEAVECVVRITPDAVGSVEGYEVLQRDGQPISLAPLARLLELPEREEGPAAWKHRLCVILKSGVERGAIVVEEVAGSLEAQLKELRPPLIRVRNVAASCLLGTGELVVSLRPSDLLKTIRQGARPPASSNALEEEWRQNVILVVDDSITTRAMEKNILEAAGYQVHLAVDGASAWTFLKNDGQAVDLVLSDVDMPRMNGFELTARIRADRKLAELPVVLVTALESREDKEQGIEVGANAYVVKSSFDKSNVLEIIHRLL